MFTGIIEQIGKVLSIVVDGTNKIFRIQLAEAVPLKVGDSIAVNGVCLTLTAISETEFSVTAIAETLRLTNLNELIVGDSVNLETPLTAGRSMGGHSVQGHIDGMARVIRLEKNDSSWIASFAMDKTLARYIVHKGFISVDGMSLTVIAVSEEQFSIAFIPHTISHTTVQFYQEGQSVNIEVDVMAKYIEQYIKKYTQEVLMP